MDGEGENIDFLAFLFTTPSAAILLAYLLGWRQVKDLPLPPKSEFL